MKSFLQCYCCKWLKEFVERTVVTVKKKKVNVGLDCCICLCFPTSYEEEDKVGGKQCFTKQKRSFFFFYCKSTETGQEVPWQTGKSHRVWVKFQKLPGFCTKDSSWNTACFLLLLKTHSCLWGELYLPFWSTKSFFLPPLSLGGLWGTTGYSRL